MCHMCLTHDPYTDVSHFKSGINVMQLNDSGLGPCSMCICETDASEMSSTLAKVPQLKKAFLQCRYSLYRGLSSGNGLEVTELRLMILSSELTSEDRPKHSFSDYTNLSFVCRATIQLHTFAE